MKKWLLTPLAAIGIAVLTASAQAQVGHPAKGSWLGYWGPSPDEQNRMLLVLDWKDRELVGVINPGRNPADVESAKIDYDTWTMTIEAEMPTDNGGTAHYVATGKLENLGSWVNRVYSGTYRFGNETGSFKLVLN